MNGSPLAIVNLSAITDLIAEDASPVEPPHEGVEEQLLACETRGYHLAFLSATQSSSWHTVSTWLEAYDLLSNRNLYLREPATVALRSYIWVPVAIAKISADIHAQEVVYVADGAFHLAPLFNLVLEEETAPHIRLLETLTPLLDEP